MTREQAIALSKTGWWKVKSVGEIARLQINEDKLCMEFRLFHAAVEAWLRRPIYTHELITQRIKDEINGTEPIPSFDPILKGYGIES